MAKKPTRGKPKVPRLDEGKQREIIAILSVGETRRIAAKYVGCHPDTIRRTALRDPDFGLRLTRAESSNEVAHLNFVKTAAADPRYWRAAAWVLERVYPDRYAARKPGVVTREHIQSLLEEFGDILLSEMSLPEEREQVLQRIDALLAQASHAGQEVTATQQEDDDAEEPNDGD